VVCLLSLAGETMTRFVLATLALEIAACGGAGGSTDVEPTLRFADLDDLQIARMVSAASASEGFQAEAQLFQFDDPFGDRTDPCPLVDQDLAGNRVTITGGCTTTDGVTIDGSATLDNPTGWGDLEYDFRSDSVYQFDQLAFTTAAGTMAWDGVFTVGPSFGDLDLDLTTDMFGIAVRSDLYMDCDSTSCKHGHSGLELVGVGGALVSGKITVSGQSAGGTMTMRGVDSVKITIANNCVAWELEGTDRGRPCP